MVWCKRCSKYDYSRNDDQFNKMTCGKCDEALIYYCDECFAKVYGAEEVCSCIACNTPMEFMKVTKVWRAPSEMHTYLIPLVCAVSTIAFVLRFPNTKNRLGKLREEEIVEMCQFLVGMASLLSFPLSACLMNERKMKVWQQYVLCAYYVLCACADVISRFYLNTSCHNSPLEYIYLIPYFLWSAIGFYFLLKQLDFSLRKTAVHRRPCAEKPKKNS